MPSRVHEFAPAYWRRINAKLPDSQEQRRIIELPIASATTAGTVALSALQQV